MNLTKTAQKKIREHVIWNSPKMTKLLKQREEFLEDLIQCFIDYLNPSERYLFEKFPNYLRLIDFSRLVELFQLTGKDVPEIGESLKLPVIYCVWNDDYNDFEVFRIAYRVIERYDDKYKKLNIPYTFSGWEDLKKGIDPERYKSLIGKLEKFILDLRAFEQEIKYLQENILDTKLIGLRDIKKFYPNLYDIIKEKM